MLGRGFELSPSTRNNALCVCDVGSSRNIPGSGSNASDGNVTGDRAKQITTVHFKNEKKKKSRPATSAFTGRISSSIVPRDSVIEAEKESLGEDGRYVNNVTRIDTAPIGDSDTSPFFLLVSTPRPTKVRARDLSNEGRKGKRSAAK